VRTDQLPLEFDKGEFINTSTEKPLRGNEIWTKEMRCSLRSHFHRQATKMNLQFDEIMFRHSGGDLFRLVRVGLAEQDSTSPKTDAYEEDPNLAII
jgi:hypothetical protein